MDIVLVVIIWLAVLTGLVFATCVWVALWIGRFREAIHLMEWYLESTFGEDDDEWPGYTVYEKEGGSIKARKRPTSSGIPE